MRTLCLLAILSTLLGLYGCATVATPLPAWIYGNVKGPIDADGSFDPTKTGRACASSILGLVATGDASIDRAKAAGGIKEVSTVDHESTSILGIWAEFCTIVRGR